MDRKLLFVVPLAFIILISGCASFAPNQNITTNSPPNVGSQVNQTAHSSNITQQINSDSTFF